MMKLEWDLEIQAAAIYLVSQLGDDAQIVPRRRLSGKSGAYVYLSDIAAKDFPSGEFITKFEVRGPEAYAVSSEADLNNSARKVNPTFAAGHIPEIVRQFKCDNVDITVVRVAEGGIEYIQPLGLANADSLPVLMQNISEGLLTAWAKTNDTTPSIITPPSKLLQAWLGNRLEAHSKGPLNAFLEKHDIPPNTSTFVLDQDVYPNPLALCISGAATDAIQIRPLHGSMHGDLHYHNILHVPGNTSNYHLIDFTHFSSDQSLFFDHAYLELSALLDMFSSYPLQDWATLVSKIVEVKKPQDLSGKGLLPRERGMVHPILFIRERVFAWIRSRYPDRVAQLDNQYRLARIAAALNFTSKRQLHDRAASCAFVYAATEARAFLAFNNVNLPSPSVTPRFALESAANAKGMWRDLWERSHNFESGRATYVLCGDLSEVAPLARQVEVIPRLPFSMIIDIAQEGSASGVVEKARTVALTRRAFHLNLPTDQPKLAFDRSMAWLMLRGNADAPASVATTVMDWRRRYRTGLKIWVDELRRQLFPKRVVLILAPSASGDLDLITRVWEEFDSVFAEHLTTVTLSCSDVKVDQLPPDLRQTQTLAVQSDILEGVLYLQGADGDQPDAVYLPRRVLDGGAGHTEIHREIFVSEDLSTIRYIEEEFQLVHRGLARADGLELIMDAAFLRGSEVSWTELEAGIDVRRDVFSSLLETCERTLESYSNDTLEFRHHPGSGGTTVARRLAWEMKERHPTLVLKSFSPQTADRVGALYSLCGLPVLLIADGGVISESDRERLFREIRGRNVRCLILHVVRGAGDNPRALSLQDPMGEGEANRFFARYATGLPAAKQRMLIQLSRDQNHRRYRSAFFFGLYAFEEAFTHVQDFVRHHIKGASHETRQALKYVSLVTCYAQMALTLDQLAALLGIDDADRSIADEVIGEQCYRLVVITEDRQIRVVHPIIAKEILRNEFVSDASGSDDTNWKVRLAEVACDLIVNFSKFSVEQDSRTNALLDQLFIKREPWSDSGSVPRTARQSFSPLLVDIDDPVSQSVVFAKLTDKFPSEPHYWNHRGRHSNLILHERYELAEGFIRRAVDLSDGQDPIHHHSLGMVYRHEVRRILTEARKAAHARQQQASSDVEQTLEAIRDLVARASECFRQARQLDTESDYGYITAVQLVIEVLRGLRDLNGFESVRELVSARSTVGRWSRAMLHECEEVFDELKERHAQETPSHLAMRCEGDLLELYGDFNGMIKELHALLEHPDAEQSVTRRLIANAYLAKRKNNWAMLQLKELRAINSMAVENLQRDQPRDQDYSHWFQSFRRLPEYDDAESRRQLMVWAQERNSIQAHYYLYILHFIRWYTGESHDLSAMQRHLSLCAVDPSNGQSSWSAEWLGNSSLKCQMVHFGELGEWGESQAVHRFYSHIGSLEPVIGIIGEISRPQAGQILIYPKNSGASDRKAKPVKAFFAPGNDFRPGRDENQRVRFYLGFSRVGLRAWAVEPALHGNK